MAKFHINKHGVPAPCKAQKGNCPYGGEESHYNSQEEAQEAIDQINEEKYSILPKSDVDQEVQGDFMENVYYPANMPERIDFVLRMENLDEDLADAENPEAIKKVFEENFDKDALIYEIDSDDPLHYSLDSLADGISSAYDDIGNKLGAEGLDVSIIHGEDGYNEDLKEAYRNYLKSKQGPVKEVFGRKLAEIEDPYEKDTEQFFRDYIQRREKPTVPTTPEVDNDFNEHAYYPSLEPSLNSYIQRMEYLEEDDFINESNNPDAIRQAFKDNFNEDAIVAEINSDDPLHYSIDSLDDGTLVAHQDLMNYLERNGYDISVIQAEGDKVDDYNYSEDFRNKYRDYLKSKQGPVKTLFGRKFAEIEDPYSDSTFQFFADYIKRNK